MSHSLTHTQRSVPSVVTPGIYLFLYSLILLSIPSQAIVSYEETFQSIEKKWNDWHNGGSNPTEIRYGQWKEAAPLRSEIRSRLESVTKLNYESWTREEKISFLLNAFTIFRLEQIALAWPVANTRTFDNKIKDFSKQEFFYLLGSKRHLSEIENDLLLVPYKHLAIPFALSHFTMDSPAPTIDWFRPHQLEQCLEARQRTFLANEKHFQIDWNQGHIRGPRSIRKYAKIISIQTGNLKEFLAGFYKGSIPPGSRADDPRFVIEYEPEDSAFPTHWAQWDACKNRSPSTKL